MITSLGSCRCDVPGSNLINSRISYTHTTKEALQLIRFLKGEITIEKPYSRFCFRTPIITINPDYYFSLTDEFQEMFRNSKVIILEICSRKKYIHNSHYLHHLCVDKRFAKFNRHTPKEILDNYKIELQTDEEIEQDILEIQRQIGSKKLIVVSHYNSLMNNSPIPSREHLINSVTALAQKHSIPFVNPKTVFEGLTQEEVVTKDLGHYTPLGVEIMQKHLESKVIKLTQQ
ncbi:MAG: hypothetical protein KTR32_33045 [Granulosicoccus sp.]|nr:hypothetical protein [Granulosicoccus sp.]